VSKTELRVVAGRWRGRKIRFAADGVRPTGARVRETLFNWLAPHLPGARCLDLFAGSGALGIEALSRGADNALFVEQNPSAAASFSKALADFAAPAGCAEVLVTDALQGGFAAHGPFTIVFVDPPFAAAGGPDLGKLCTLLEASASLAERSFIYLEMDKREPLPDLPAGWQTLREKTAGQVRYALVERNNHQRDHI